MNFKAILIWTGALLASATCVAQDVHYAFSGAIDAVLVFDTLDLGLKSGEAFTGEFWFEASTEPFAGVPLAALGEDAPADRTPLVSAELTFDLRDLTSVPSLNGSCVEQRDRLLMAGNPACLHFRPSGSGRHRPA